MKTVQISLNSIGKVKSFVNTISQFEYDFDLISGRYVIDAKSIMGIFSLDLSKPIDLAIHTEDNLNEILEAIHYFPVITYKIPCLYCRQGIFCFTEIIFQKQIILHLPESSLSYRLLSASVRLFFLPAGTLIF